MRIGLISTVDGPVCQSGSGAIQSLVWLLSRELTRMGHEITVFGLAGSEPCGKLVATLGEASHSFDDWQIAEWINVCRAVEDSAAFDVLHCHGYLWELPLEPMARAPIVHTLHLWPTRDELYLRSLTPSPCVTAISNCQWSEYPAFKPAATIYHGVDASQFTFSPEPDDYVCFMGQFAWGKGPTVAIEAARALGLSLLLAGPRSEYYHRYVEPLVDGQSVQYVGCVSGSERDRLLGGARALLYPIQSKEPFGLVQVEAMMCGTPVAAIDVGAVSEIVDEGVTGFYAPSSEGFASALQQALALDRRRVRSRAEERFSAERMAREYVHVYEELVSRRAGLTGAGAWS